MLLVPAQVEDADHRPGVAVDHAALQRGVDLARRHLHHGGVLLLQEVAVDRRDAQLQPGEVGLVDLLVAVDVVLHALAGARVVVQALVGIAGVDLVEDAVLAHLGLRQVGVVQRQAVGHQPGREGRGGVGHVDHAVAQRVRLLEGGYGLRAADVVDLHDALAFVVDLLDELLEAAREVGAFLEGVDRLQRHFLGDGGAAGQQQGEAAGAGRSRCVFAWVFSVGG